MYVLILLLLYIPSVLYIVRSIYHLYCTLFVQYTICTVCYSVCLFVHCSIVSTTSTGQKLIGLVKNIIDSYKETLTILQLEHFSSFIHLFGYRGRKSITLTLAETLLENGVVIPSVEEVRTYIHICVFSTLCVFVF